MRHTVILRAHWWFTLSRFVDVVMQVIRQDLAEGARPS